MAVRFDEVETRFWFTIWPHLYDAMGDNASPFVTTLCQLFLVRGPVEEETEHFWFVLWHHVTTWSGIILLCGWRSSSPYVTTVPSCHHCAFRSMEVELLLSTFLLSHVTKRSRNMQLVKGSPSYCATTLSSLTLIHSAFYKNQKIVIQPQNLFILLLFEISII